MDSLDPLYSCMLLDVIVTILEVIVTEHHSKLVMMGDLFHFLSQNHAVFKLLSPAVGLLNLARMCSDG